VQLESRKTPHPCYNTHMKKLNKSGWDKTPRGYDTRTSAPDKQNGRQSTTENSPKQGNYRATNAQNNIQRSNTRNSKAGRTATANTQQVHKSTSKSSYKAKYNTQKDNHSSKNDTSLKYSSESNSKYRNNSQRQSATKQNTRAKTINSNKNKSSKYPTKSHYNSQNNKKHMNNKQTYSKHLKLCTLSGTKEIGSNANFVEYGNDIVIIDYGFNFPGQDLLGIDYTIPNFNYLVKNKHRIKGILITHGHLDHTGGLAYVMEMLDYPTIYAGRYPVKLMETRFKEAKILNKVKFEVVHRNTKVQLGEFNAHFIGITHSIPNSFSIMLSSNGGNIFISGDYKMDPTPAGEQPTDIATMKSISKNIDLALMESTNPEKKGKALSDKVVRENLHEIIKQHKGRVVVGAFASYVSRLYSLVQIAQATNRKLAVAGRSLVNSTKIVRELNYMTFPENLLITEAEIAKYPDDQILFACTGSQGERYAALNRISLNEHKYFKAKPADLIILSSSEIPGNQHVIEKMTDRLLEKGITLVQSNMADVHGSGHGYQGDMKELYDVIQPRHVMPVHGSLTKRYKNKLNMLKWGATEEKTYLTTDGAIWTYFKTTDQWKQTSKIEASQILIDGLGVGDISEIVLQDRDTLSQFGMVTIVLNLSAKNKAIIGKPRFVSRGFVYVKNSKQLFNELEQIVIDRHRAWHTKAKKNHRFEMKDLYFDIEKPVKRYIYKKTEREPLVLPVFI